MNRLMFTLCLRFLRREKRAAVSMETVVGQRRVFFSRLYDELPVETGVTLAVGVPFNHFVKKSEVGIRRDYLISGCLVFYSRQVSVHELL